MANFKKDEKAAQTENFSAGAIKETGLYIGHFTKAYLRNSKTSAAEAIHLDFVSHGGHHASIDIWYKKGDGEDMERGINQIQGLMALLDIENLREKPNDTVEMYDWELKAVKQVRMTTYPQLIDKMIGTVWQMEEYIKQVNIDGKWVDSSPIELKERAVFVRFCDGETHQTPGEKINGVDAKVIETFIVKMPDCNRVSLPKEKLQEARDTASFSKADMYNDEMPF